jgi:hypothetical protein
MLAAVWLQVLAAPEFDPTALKVVVPPVLSLPENSPPNTIEKLLQSLAPVKVATNGSRVVSGAIATNVAPQLFDPVLAGAIRCVIVQPGEVKVMPLIGLAVGWHWAKKTTASPTAFAAQENEPEPEAAKNLLAGTHPFGT